jgi:O-antigen/teichoic acid export membrane protein
MSLSFVIGGLRITPEGLLQRRFAFRTVALTQIGSYVVGYALVGVTMALLGFGAWSLVAATLCTGAFAAVVYALLCRHDIGIRMNWHSFKTLYSFGGRVSLTAFCQAIASSLDTVWSGHYLGAAATGVYTRATNLANTPLNALLVSVGRVLLPGYSRLQHQRGRLRSVYIITITTVAAIGMPVSWGIAGAARQIIITLLGDQWLEAIPVLAVLSLAVPFTMLTHVGAMICEATATLNVKIVIALGRIGWLVALLAVLTRYGVVGIAAAFALSEFINHIAYLLVMRRMFSLSLAELWHAYSLGATVGIITGAALYGINVGLTAMGWPAPVILAVQVALGALLLLGTITRARGGEQWREIKYRLGKAGYHRENRGLAAWLIRRIDGFGPRELNA